MKEDDGITFHPTALLEACCSPVREDKGTGGETKTHTVGSPMPFSVKIPRAPSKENNGVITTPTAAASVPANATSPVSI